MSLAHLHPERHRADAPCVVRPPKRREFRTRASHPPCRRNLPLFLTRATPERDTNGAIVRCNGTSTDVHEARAQRTLQVFSELGPRCRRRSKCKPRWMLRCTWSFRIADWAFINLLDENGDIRVARSTIATSESGGARQPNWEPYASAARSSRKWASPQRSSPADVGNVERGSSTCRFDAAAASEKPTRVFQELARRIAPAIGNAELFERDGWWRSFQDAALPATLPDIPACTFSAIYEAGAAKRSSAGLVRCLALADGRVVLSIATSPVRVQAVTMANMRQAIRGVAYVHPDPC